MSLSPRTNLPSPPVMVVAGAFPPPIHGAALVTVALCEALETRGCRVLRCDTAPTSAARGLRWTISRAARVGAAMVRLALSAPGGQLVLQGAGGAGNLYNAALALVGRARGYRIALHHHSFAYLNRHDPIVTLLARCLGRNCLHIVLCQRMGDMLATAYGVRRTMVLSNVAFVPPAPPPTPRSGPFVLGHVSMLGHEKGLDLVLDTVRALRAGGADIRLILAGAADARVQAEIGAANAELGGIIDYRGLVSGAAKQGVFAELDAFLFPSRNEAQACVLFEAMANGAPVIATARGCISDNVVDSGDMGLAVSPCADFVATATAQVTAWMADRAAFDRLRHRVWHAAVANHQAALAALNQVIMVLMEPQQ
jgi:glycosyltransferase involved in cell wall biosynthesis